jgi:hypothetical protein
LIAVNVGDPGFPIEIQSWQQPEFFALPTVHAHPTIPKPLAAGVAYHLQGQLCLATKQPFLILDPCLFAAFRVAPAFLRKLQPLVNLIRLLAARQSREHPHMVPLVSGIDLSQASAPLPGNAYRFLAFRGNGTFVDNQETAFTISKRTVGIAGHLIQYSAVTPRRVRYEMLIGLIIAISHDFSHALHVPFFRLYQSKQIILRLLNNIPRSCHEEIMEPA